MSDQICSSCGQGNASTLVYCAHCGGLLSKFPKGSESTPLPTSVAVAARRVQMTEEEPEPPRSFFSRLIGFISYLLSVGVGVALVLMFMEPKAPLSQNQPIANTPNLSKQLFASSRYTPALISQQVINDFLKVSIHPKWKAPFDFIPTPQWSGSSVLLENGKLTYFLNVSMFDYPLHFSESFHLTGASHQWSLEPEEGSVGLLPVKGFLLKLLTPFMETTIDDVRGELTTLHTAETLEISPGWLKFTTR